jgi:hypothetical protein
MAEHACTTPEQTKSSRRALLGGLMAAPVVLATPASALGGSSSAVHDLWNERRALRPVSRDLEERIEEATAKMPWWAQEGPDLLKHDGTFIGSIVGWPAIQDMEPPSQGAYRLIRPSPMNLRKDYDRWISVWGRPPGTDASARQQYVKNLRALALRRRQQNIERAKVGRDELEARYDNTRDHVLDLNVAIEGLSGFHPDALAAKLLVGLHWTASTADSTGSNCESLRPTLEALRPHLSGNIAADVADLLDNPEAPLTERMAWV